MVNNPIKFGTDGWRGIIAEDFTFDNVRICAQAVALYLYKTQLAKRGLVIGYDTRFASREFASAAAEVIAANGIKVYLCNKAEPTPVISYGVVAKKAGGAIVITASHNPGKWNGFKIKSENGASAPTEVISKIEENVRTVIESGKINRLPLTEAIDKGLVEYIDLYPAYRAQIAKLVDLDGMKSRKLKIAVDSMFGSGAGYFKALLKDSAFEIIEINDLPNPAFPGMKQPEPIAVNLAGLSELIKNSKSDAGLATDGDSDRIGVMDENGNFLTQLQIYALLALYLLEVRKERGAIIKTITTTAMLDKLGKIYDVPVYETKVGFKYVAPLMLEHDAMIGGEESGGYGLRGHVPERDALLAGLCFLDFMVKTGKKPSQLLKDLYDMVGEHYYDRLDIEFPEDRRDIIIERVRNSHPKSIDNTGVVKEDTIDGFRYTLADGTWLLIRFSGTEPLLRIYTESNSLQRVKRLLEIGKKITGA
ncbi:MAG: phosphoglucomutase/phosphomannomutase family protein [Dehalococcoidales bacterium]|nr:phosphoglucomutase/phosphomannomutase family protein [Dehalococcoidales bacterium]